MEPILINVNKSLDGFTFSLLPAVRAAVKARFPNAQPANLLFVNYDVKGNWAQHLDKLERFIYPALLGVDKIEDAHALGEILFVDNRTGDTLLKLRPREQKV